MSEFVVLLICTGNTCRSPMAARLLEHELDQRGIVGVRILSAGISAVRGAAAAEEAEQVLATGGLSLGEHRSRQVSRRLLRQADLVLTMTAAHRERLLYEYSMRGLPEKTFVLREYAHADDGTESGEETQWDVADPYGRGLEEYRRAVDEIGAAVTAAVPRLLNEVKARREVSTMVIGIGSDHAGYSLKQKLVDFLAEAGYEVVDVGTDSMESVDYPDFAEKIAHGVVSGEFERGVLVCGTGIGMSIAANKIPGVRAALCHDVFSARATREDNDANVLTLGARVIGEGLAMAVLDEWLGAEFQGGRHARRVAKIRALEAPENRVGG